MHFSSRAEYVDVVLRVLATLHHIVIIVCMHLSGVTVCFYGNYEAMRLQNAGFFNVMLCYLLDNHLLFM